MNEISDCRLIGQSDASRKRWHRLWNEHCHRINGMKVKCIILREQNSWNLNHWWRFCTVVPSLPLSILRSTVWRHATFYLSLVKWDKYILLSKENSQYSLYSAFNMHNIFWYYFFVEFRYSDCLLTSGS